MCRVGNVVQQAVSMAGTTWEVTSMSVGTVPLPTAATTAVCECERAHVLGAAWMCLLAFQVN